MKMLSTKIKYSSFIPPVLLVLVLMFRFFLFSFPGFKIDMADWQAWTARLVESGPLNFYAPGFFADYLPFFYILLWMLGEIFVMFMGKAAIFSTAFIFYIKFIGNIFDLLTAYTIFLVVKKHIKKWAMVAPLLYLANPSIIFNSSVWGQLDSIPTFFFLWAIYMLEENSNLRQWSIFSTLSFIIKPYNVSILPLMFIRLVKDFKIRQIIAPVIIGIIIFFGLIIPFFPQNPFFGVLSHLVNSLNVYPYTSLNAYNFWGLFGWWKPDNILWLGIGYHVWGYILFSFFVLLIILPYLKPPGFRIERNLDYFAYALSALAFFLFLTRIHERYFFPVFALLLISAFVYKSRVLISFYLIFAVVNFINLFYSYYYYNVIYSTPAAPGNFLFDLSDNYKLFFSLISVFMFLIMLAIYFKSCHRFLKTERPKDLKKIRSKL